MAAIPSGQSALDGLVVLMALEISRVVRDSLFVLVNVCICRMVHLLIVELSFVR